MLMTNMMFTKGVGSPTFMAPEVLNKKFKKAASVFLFGVTMFECFTWGDAFPKALFKFPWDTVSFINSRVCLATTNDISETVCPRF